jgi:hypothetical protein
MNSGLRVHRGIIRAIFLCVSLLSVNIVFAQKSTNHNQTDRFAGIGISIDIDSTVMLPITVEVLSGKPGAMAGLRSGDYIIAINHWKTYKKSKEKIVSRLRGKKGSFVELIIKRNGVEQKFRIQRQPIIVSKEPANLCEALDSMIKSAADTFSNLEGRMLNDSIRKNQVPNYEWMSTLSLPKFARSRIIKRYDMNARFESVFFEGKDSVQAVNRFDRLVSDVRDCLPYTASVSFQESNSAIITGFYTSFVISQAKGPFKGLIEGSVITVKFEHQRNMPAQVRLVYTINKNDAAKINL